MAQDRHGSRRASCTAAAAVVALALLAVASAPRPAAAAAARVAAAAAAAPGFVATARAVNEGDSLVITGYRLEGDAADSTFVLERRQVGGCSGTMRPAAASACVTPLPVPVVVRTAASRQGA